MRFICMCRMPLSPVHFLLDSDQFPTSISRSLPSRSWIGDLKQNPIFEFMGFFYLAKLLTLLRKEYHPSQRSFTAGGKVSSFFPSKLLIAFEQAWKMLWNDVHIRKFWRGPSEIWNLYSVIYWFSITDYTCCMDVLWKRVWWNHLHM